MDPDGKVGLETPLLDLELGPEIFFKIFLYID